MKRETKKIINAIVENTIKGADMVLVGSEYDQEDALEYLREQLDYKLDKKLDKIRGY